MTCLLLLLSCLSALPTSADQASPILVPFDAEGVDLKSWDGEIRMRLYRVPPDLDRRWYGDSASEDFTRWASCRFRYLLVNAGRRPSFQVALPQLVRLKGMGPRRRVRDIHLRVDGVPVKPRELPAPARGEELLSPDRSRPLALLGPTALTPDGDGAKVKWWVWNISCPPGQSRLVELSYENVGFSRLMTSNLSRWPVQQANLRLVAGEGSSLAWAASGKADWDQGVLEGFPHHNEPHYLCWDVLTVKPRPSQFSRLECLWLGLDEQDVEVKTAFRRGGSASSVLEAKIVYGPQMLLDGRVATAWVPAKPIGERAYLPLRVEDCEAPRSLRKLKIFNGYGKSQELYHANNRVKRLEILGPTTLGMQRRRDVPLQSYEVTLEDHFGWQTINLPEKLWLQAPARSLHSLDYSEQGLTLRILDVYPGSRFDDTCLSEVQPLYE